MMPEYPLSHTNIEPHGYKLPRDARIKCTVGYVKDDTEAGQIEMEMVLPGDTVVVAIWVTAND